MPLSFARPVARRAVTSLFLAAAVAACGHDNPAAPKTSGFDVVAGAGTTDTVGASQLQALVVSVRDEAGHTVGAGTVVNFAVSAPTDSLRRYERGMYLCPLSATSCGIGVGNVYYFGTAMYNGIAISDTTDARGQAKVQVAFGSVAGPAHVVITVPEFGTKDSVTYTVKAGAAARLRITTRDTLLSIGAHFAEHANVVDRFGNARSETGTFVASSGGAVSVDAAGLVTATSFGRTGVVARYAALADTAYVSVPPSGRLVAYASNFDGTSGWSIVMMNLDGTYRRRVTTSQGQDAAFPDLSPDRQKIAFIDRDASGAGLFIVDSSGNNRKLLVSGTVFGPRFSADGTKIYYNLAGTYPNGTNLWSIGVDGSGATKLWSAPNSSFGGYFDVSADGTKAVWATGSVMIIDLTTGVLKGVPGASSIWARWAPDGTIVYSGNYDGAMYTMASDGTNIRRIPSTSSYLESLFGLSTDGKWVLTGNGYSSGSMAVVQVSTGATIPLNLRAVLYEPSLR